MFPVAGMQINFHGYVLVVYLNPLPRGEERHAFESNGRLVDLSQIG